MEPIRNFLRHKKAAVKYYEAEATKIDYEKRVVYINDDSPIKGDINETEVPFDMLVVGVGAEDDSDNETFPSPMMGVDNDDEEDDDLRASITSAGYARVQAARNVRMRQAQNRFGRFMRRGGPRDSLD